MTKIGTDIVRIDRIESSIQKHGDRFLRRFMSEKEITYAKKAESAAGYWAAKEALSKALGCGIGSKLTFHDISIEKSPDGAPLVKFTKNVVDRFDISESSISISHDGNFAIAVAIIVIEEKNKTI